MAPYQTTVMLDDARDGQDVVEVQILPQVIVLRYILFCKTKIFFILMYIVFAYEPIIVISNVYFF